MVPLVRQGRANQRARENVKPVIVSAGVNDAVPVFADDYGAVRVAYARSVIRVNVQVESGNCVFASDKR